MRTAVLVSDFNNSFSKSDVYIILHVIYSVFTRITSVYSYECQVFYITGTTISTHDGAQLFAYLVYMRFSVVSSTPKHGCPFVEASWACRPNLIQFCVAIPEVPQPLITHPSCGLLLVFASCFLVDFSDFLYVVLRTSKYCTYILLFFLFMHG